MLDTWASGRSIKQRTNQKTIRQPIVQVEHSVGDDAKIHIANFVLVFEWPGAENSGTFKFEVSAVIDKGFGLDMEVHRGVHGHKREHGHVVGYKPPFDTLPSAMDGVEEGCHTLEE